MATPNIVRQDLHDSLKLACHAAIKAGSDFHSIKLDRWATTFGCDEAHVSRMWEHELTKLSRQPRNAYEEPAE